ncbi:hypothetical protein DAD186_14020 [Dermabacter vaginalis]|uniref:Uncharacterized protein n=1 Tax=Dermabacter vaginalis TaxID=1630135 RepID=A0A1B0ZJC9_9MICO|nr:hypothetical protein DAD186_14020 [Dermabacter vaginalis]
MRLHKGLSPPDYTPRLFTKSKPISESNTFDRLPMLGP